MTQETVLDQIERLRGVLNRVARGMSLPDDIPLLNSGNLDKTLEQKLMALTVASVSNLVDTLQNRHEQISLGLHFARFTTFYARQIKPDLDFWSLEINDDITQQNFLLQSAQTDLEEFISRAGKHPRVLPIAQQHKNLADEFMMRHRRRVQGQPMYDQSEKPGEFADNKVRALFLTTRDRQLHATLQEINLLINRALFSAKRLNVLEASDLPELQKAGIDNEIARHREISTTLEYGLSQLDQAETMLRYHAARHSAFSDRLDSVKPQP